MATNATIESAMTPYPYSIEMDAHVSSAKSMLAQFGIRHLPVKQGQKLAGIITLRDIKRAEAYGIDTSINSDVRVEKICNKEVYIVKPGESLVNVLKHMADHYIDSALVVRDGKLAGIFTFSDAFKRYIDLLSKY
ncbi:MAG: CBS domain-containing protein [Gammaproteobacteria bacterium]|nr:CBS domain-containing protein [Gammaproteobacteria bacterium]